MTRRSCGGQSGAGLCETFFELNWGCRGRVVGRVLAALEGGTNGRPYSSIEKCWRIFALFFWHPGQSVFSHKPLENFGYYNFSIEEMLDELISPDAVPAKANGPATKFEFPTRSEYSLPADAVLPQVRNDRITDRILIRGELWKVGNLVRQGCCCSYRAHQVACHNPQS